MKVEVLARSCSAKNEYPCLKRTKSSEVLVLFTNPCTGTVLHDPSGRWVIGYHSVNWTQSEFEPFYGTVSISSD